MENKNLKNYESVIILKENLSEEEYHKEFDKIKDYMEDLVEFEKIEELGLKRLAYEVQGNKTGYYVVIEFYANNEDIKNLESYFRKNEDVLKWIFVKKED